MRGPIDYIVVGFRENNFTGEILKELEKVSSNGTIKVLDIAVIARDKYGNVAAIEMTDPKLVSVIKDMDVESGLISEEDVSEVGELLDYGTSAGLLIVEQLWAKPLKASILNKGGFLISEGRIHPEASKELDMRGAK